MKKTRPRCVAMLRRTGVRAQCELPAGHMDRHWSGEYRMSWNDPAPSELGKQNDSNLEAK